jgi:hypothetical protein
MHMSNLAFLHQETIAATVAQAARRQAPGPDDSPFWCSAIGSGSAAIVTLAKHIDVLSQRIGELPVRAAGHVRRCLHRR